MAGHRSRNRGRWLIAFLPLMEGSQMKNQRRRRPVSLVCSGRRYDRVTIRFARRAGADDLRARVFNALIRAGGFRLATGLTDALARGLGRHRSY